MSVQRCGKPVRHSEVLLGPPVLSWLAEEGWDAYQEVVVGAPVADIVATSGRIVAVVELKIGLTWELLYQAIRWRHDAHLVWVAVPQAKASDGRRVAERVFGDKGIGILSVRWAGGADPRVEVVQRPALNRRAEAERIRSLLRPEHKTFAPAGMSHGGRWTPFRETCDRLRRYVGENPGAPLKAAIGSIQHHYASGSSARAHLIDLIGRGVVPGVSLKREGKALSLWPAEGAGA